MKSYAPLAGLFLTYTQRAACHSLYIRSFWNFYDIKSLNFQFQQEVHMCVKNLNHFLSFACMRM